MDATANDQIGQMPVEILTRIALFLVASCVSFAAIDQLWALLPKVRRSWRAIFGGRSFWIRALDAMPTHLREEVERETLTFRGAAHVTRVPYTATDIAPRVRSLKVGNDGPDIGFVAGLLQLASFRNLKLLRFGCTMKGDPAFDNGQVCRVLESCRAPIEILVFPAFVRLNIFGDEIPQFQLYPIAVLAGAVEKHSHLGKVVLRDLPSDAGGQASLLASLSRLPALRTLVIADTSNLSPTGRVSLGTALRTFPALTLLDITYNGAVVGERREYERLCEALPSAPAFKLRAKGPRDEFHDDDVGFLTDTGASSLSYGTDSDDFSSVTSESFDDDASLELYESWDDDSDDSSVWDD